MPSIFSISRQSADETAKLNAIYLSIFKIITQNIDGVEDAKALAKAEIVIEVEIKNLLKLLLGINDEEGLKKELETELQGDLSGIQSKIKEIEKKLMKAYNSKGDLEDYQTKLVRAAQYLKKQKDKQTQDQGESPMIENGGKRYRRKSRKSKKSRKKSKKKRKHYKKKHTKKRR